MSIIRITRPANIFITALSVLLAVYIAGDGIIISAMILLIITASIFSCAAGNVINDIFDFEIDKINHPDRVLPSKEMTMRQAKFLYSFLVLISLVFGFLAGIEFFVFVFAANILLFLYSLRLKKFLLLGNIVVAFSTSLPLIIGGMAVDNIPDIIIPAAFAFGINFIREIIKDIEDAKGDTIDERNSFAISYGESFSIKIFFTATVLFMISTTLPFLLGIYTIEYFFIIMIVVNPTFVYMLKLIIKEPNSKSYRKSSTLIKLNMLFGITAILAGV